MPVNRLFFFFLYGSHANYSPKIKYRDLYIKCRKGLTLLSRSLVSSKTQRGGGGSVRLFIQNSIRSENTFCRMLFNSTIDALSLCPVLCLALSIHTQPKIDKHSPRVSKLLPGTYRPFNYPARTRYCTIVSK